MFTSRFSGAVLKKTLFIKNFESLFWSVKILEKNKFQACGLIKLNFSILSLKSKRFSIVITYMQESQVPLSTLHHLQLPLSFNIQ